ncbi:MAG: YfhO family protein, partial [Clostridiales bacterium]|nr:YfhO family protein [Clostridiales bacterium]
SVKASTGKDIDAEFYILDLDAFGDVVARIRARQANSIEIREGYVKVTADAAGDGEKLFISVPFDPSWKVTVNGKVTVPDRFDGCMTLVSLEKGKNEIVMEYHSPYMLQGAIASAAGIILVLAAGIVYGRTCKKHVEK